jgi:hypothetical protein
MLTEILCERCDMNNKITLNKKTADHIVDLSSDIRKAGVELAKYAAILRDQYLDSQGHYDADFNKFWRDQDLDKRFGQKSNFTKYALAGNALEKIQANFPEMINLEERLPRSVAALYELSQLSVDEIRLCLENTYIRKDLTSSQNDWKRPKKAKPLITPSVTAAELKSWREKWRNPIAPSTDSRRLLLAVVKIDKSLNDYDKETGKYIGNVDREDVVKITEALKQTISNFKSDLVRLDLYDQKLIDDADKREATALKAAERLKKK